MQYISSYISSIKLKNVVIISKIGFKETSLFKPHILAWKSSSTQQLVWLHGLATSRHAIFLDLSILTVAQFFTKKSLVLCSMTFKLWWLSLVPYWISFPTPIPMIHSDPGCEKHIISKMMAKHTTKFWSEMRTSATCSFLPFQLWNCWETQWEIHYKTH